jgi:hypothetical protein
MYIYICVTTYIYTCQSTGVNAVSTAGVTPAKLTLLCRIVMEIVTNDDNDDDVYLKEDYNKDVTKFHRTISADQSIRHK